MIRTTKTLVTHYNDSRVLGGMNPGFFCGSSSDERVMVLPSRIRLFLGIVVTSGCAVVASPLLTGWPALAEEALPSPGIGIAAIVGNEVINYAELDKRVDQYLERELGSTTVPDSVREGLRWQVMDRLLVRELLLLQEAKRKDITAADQEIRKVITRKIEDLRRRGQDIRNEEDYYKISLETRNRTKEQILEDAKKLVLREKLLWTEVFPTDPFVSPQDKRDFYRKNVKQFQTPSEITFRQIFLPREEDSLDAIEEINIALDAGVDFVELVKRYSRSANARFGGLWENKKVDDLSGWPAALQTHLRTLKSGQIAREIRTLRAIFYIKMESIKLGEVSPFEEVQEKIERLIGELRRREKEDAYIKNLKRRFVVRIFLSPPKEGDEQSPTAGAATAKKNEEPAESPVGVKDVSPDASKPKK